MRTRQQVEERLKRLRKQPFTTDQDLGIISALLWVIESWDWETEKAQLEARIKALESQLEYKRKSPV